VKFRVLITLVLTVPLVSGCCALPDLTDLLGQGSLIGSGNVVTVEFDLSGFDDIEVSNAFDVEISQGDAFSVLVRVDDNVEQYLDVVKEGSTLKIGVKPLPLSSVTAVTLEAEVTMPELRGASSASTAGFQSGGPFYAEVSGASSLQGDIEAGGVRFDVSGASDVTLIGAAADLAVDVSGASAVDLARFPVSNASIGVSGASSATVNASGTLDVEASGGSRVRYLGSPNLGSVDSSGGSTIEAW